jgi:hypothetical protein
MVVGAGSRDDIDAPHGAATMRADGDLTFGEGIVAGFLISRSVADSKELTAESDFIVASAIGEEAIVADAVEAVRQGVQEKATNKPVGIKCHDFGFAVLPIVLPGKAHLAVGKRDQPTVGDGDAMRIAAEISQHLFGTAEWRLGIDDPVGPSELIEALSERGGIGEVCEIAKEAQLASREGGLQLLQKQAAEQPREDAHRQEEAGPASDPACAVERGSTAGHDAVDMRMVLQGLAPGMEDGGHAELSAEMLGVGRDGGERLRRAAEQDGIDDGLVLEGDLSGGRRHGEDDVEIRHGKEFGLSLGEPLRTRRALALWAMPIATGVVGDARRTTVVALLDMAAERRRPARGDGAHHATLDATEMTGIRLSKSFAVVAEYVRHLQSRTHDARSAGRHDLQSQPVKRTRGLADRFGGNLGVACRALQAGMAEQHLDDTNVGAVLQKMSRKTVP